MSDLLLIEEMKSYLVAQGLVEDPPASDPTPTTVYQASLPVIWLQPRFGAPQPLLEPNPATGQPRQTATVTLELGPGIPARPYESDFETRIVDCYVRCTKAPAGELIHRQIRHALEDKRAWQMGALFVLSSYTQRLPQFISADQYTYDTVQSFLIEASKQALSPA